MKFKPVTEGGITVTVASTAKGHHLYDHLIQKLDTFDMDVEYERSVQCADGTYVEIKVGYVKGVPTPFIATKHECTTLIHACSVGEQKVGDGMLLSVLNAHQCAGLLELATYGRVELNDFDTLEDLIYTFQMLDKSANRISWDTAASAAEQAIEIAYNTGALADYQFKALASRLKRATA